MPLQVFLIWFYIKQRYEVTKHGWFDSLVDRILDSKSRRCVYLKQPGLLSAVDYHVKTEELEAAVKVWRKSGKTEKRVDDNYLDAEPKQLEVIPSIRVVIL